MVVETLRCFCTRTFCTSSIIVTENAGKKHSSCVLVKLKNEAIESEDPKHCHFEVTDCERGNI